MALHPVDIMDAATGRLLTQLVDANLATICPVNKPHPRLPLIVSGSSRSLYAWRPTSSGALHHPGTQRCQPRHMGVLAFLEASHAIAGSPTCSCRCTRSRLGHCTPQARQIGPRHQNAGMHALLLCFRQCAGRCV